MTFSPHVITACLSVPAVQIILNRITFRAGSRER